MFQGAWSSSFLPVVTFKTGLVTRTTTPVLKSRTSIAPEKDTSGSAENNTAGSAENDLIPKKRLLEEKRIENTTSVC